MGQSKLLLALVLPVSAGCTPSKAEVSESRPAFAVASPQPANTGYDHEYVGEVRAIKYAELRSRLKGVVESVAVDEGQEVQGNQLLFSIRAGTQQQELARARAATKNVQAELSLAQLERKNTEMLFQKNVVSDAEMALASSKIESLNARLDEAKAIENQASILFTHAKIRAPFAGMVNRIPYKSGSAVAEDQLLTTLTDTSEVYVYFRVTEKEYLEYTALPADKRPKTVRMKLVDGSPHPHPGVIDAIESELSKETGTLAFRARFPNPDGRLKQGSSAKVVVTTEVPGALLVPQKSTFEVQGHLYVYTLDPENKTRAQQIVAKVRLKDSFLIESGLRAEDRFIVEGVQKVKEGMRVDVRTSG